MKPNQKQFITMWDTLGFECIVDITSYERTKLLHVIKGEDSELKPPVSVYHLLLRAKANPQRFPEIWSFTTTDDITQEDLIEISKDTYKNKEKIRSVSFVDNLITHSNVSEDTVYHLVKAVFENFSDFQKEHEAFAKLNIQQMIKQGIAAPLHSGAIKYYKEKGWM